jgi:transcription initiation factor TFIIIB Brf1 subunit/transcription initiation factor TFIIB
MKIKSIKCPNCKTKNSIKNTKGKTLVCTSCGKLIDLQKNEVIKSKRRNKRKKMSYLQLGDKGKIDDHEVEILGYILYKGGTFSETWYWEEWFAVSDDKYFWINFDPEKNNYIIYRQIIPKKPIDPKKIKLYQTVHISETEKFRVTEIDYGEVENAEGLIPWKIKIGEIVGYIDGKLNNLRYSIEWTEDEIEIYKGMTHTRRQVLKAFNQKEGLKKLKKEEKWKKQMGILTSSIVTIIIVCLIFMCCLMSIVDATSPSGPHFFTSSGTGFGK